MFSPSSEPACSFDGPGEAAPVQTLPQEPVAAPGPCGLCGRRNRRNNPFVGRWARHYDFLLSLPLIGSIRRSEERVLEHLMAAALRPTDHVLEIGPGTGRSTAYLSRRVAHVTAVEQSAEMVRLLEKRLQREAITNCSVILGDFAAVDFEDGFDVVALMGVLDYVPDPEPFLSRAAGLARRELLFTTPHCGPLARAFRAGNRLRGVEISIFTPAQICAYLPEFRVEVTETGLRTPLWRGMTLACRAVRIR